MGVLLMMRGSPAAGRRSGPRGGEDGTSGKDQPAGLAAGAGLIGVAKGAAMRLIRRMVRSTGCGVYRRESNADATRAVKVGRVSAISQLQLGFRPLAMTRLSCLGKPAPRSASTTIYQLCIVGSFGPG